MSRFFDIMPPKPRPAPTPTPRRKKNGWGWVLFVASLIILGILATQITSNKTPSNNTQTSSDNSTANQNNFELFDPSGQSNLTQEKVLTIRILNASGLEASAELVKKSLETAGFKIEQMGNSENKYDQMIIYYKKGELTNGQKVETVLKNNFQTKLQESESLGTTYDVLVIIGLK